jgi:DNA-binding CsgD family transcriptional regulator
MMKEHLPYFYSKKHLLDLPENLTNLGIYYSRVDSFAQSEKCYVQALGYARTLGDTFSLARIYSNLGIVKRKSGDYKAAITYQDSAYGLCLKSNLTFGIFINHINRAEILVSQKKWYESLESLNKASAYTQFNGIPEYQSEILDIYYRAYEGQGNAFLALAALKRHKKLQDSLASVESKSRLSELDNLYKKEKTSREMAEWKEKESREQFKNRMIYFSLILIILSLLVLLNRIRARKKLETLQRKLAEEENEKLLLAVKAKDGELLTQAVHQLSIRELAESLRTNLVKLSLVTTKQQKAEIESLLSDLQNRIEGDQWLDFEGKFSQINQDFYDILLSLGPDLTPTELKVCGFLRLNMSSKEIALLTHRTVPTIDNNRSIIRRKLNLPTDTNLTAYLLTIK